MRRRRFALKSTSVNPARQPHALLMTAEILLVLFLTTGTVYLFVTEKFRADLVAMMALGATPPPSAAEPTRWFIPPGGYRFTEFVTVGIPLNLIFWGQSVYFISKLWPF